MMPSSWVRRRSFVPSGDQWKDLMEGVLRMRGLAPEMGTMPTSCSMLS